ncbi:hypothetical protein GQ607_003434 [Colletotrichum asianum]|uniref:NB-ARC domain-containing protein n=1 Tax=Colletotrichum asianum TaxID=702518 RepID=A0A8H3ZY64_9PEZI|nr:hypothetical protein GQ607_003434 [Colletotrichum asianum]
MTEPWPKVLLPSELPNARILAYGYDARVTSPKEMVSVSRIRDHASTFLTRLANYRAKDDKEALVRSHHRPEPHLSSVAESTRGILFLGTPHHGSALAVWADRFSRSVGILKQTNPNIVDLLRPDSEVLAEIQDSFHTMLQQIDIEITCFFEELPLVGIGLVVPQDSAIIPGKGCLGIHGNHRSMAKFTGPDDPGFVDVRGELRRFTKSMNRPKPITSQQDHAGNGGVAHFIVPYRKNKNFVGRSDVFERLKRTFCHGPQYDINDAEPRACIYGLGGVGKTQIALSYVHWLRKLRPDMSILWVYASNEDRFKQAFANIAETLGIPNRQSPSVNILTLVKELFCPPPSLSQPGPESNGGLARFIPDCDHGSVLITTRDKQTGVRLSKGHPPLEIEAMSSDESAEMIRRFTGDSSSQLIDADILALSNRLKNLPLALAQAAAFIQENSISIARYLEILAESDDALLGLLSQDFEAVGREFGIPHAIMATWAVSFNEIQRRDPLADQLLSFITSFDRQAIP